MHVCEFNQCVQVMCKQGFQLVCASDVYARFSTGVCKWRVLQGFLTGVCEWCRETHLSVFVQNGAEESVGVWESLRAGTFSHADHAVLLRVQDTALGEETGRWDIAAKTGFNLESTAKTGFKPRNYSQQSSNLEITAKTGFKPRNYSQNRVQT